MEEPRGTVETGKSTSSSLSETVSWFSGSSQHAFFSALTCCFRVFKFSASMMAKQKRSGVLGGEFIMPSVLGPGGMGVVSLGSEGGPACMPQLHPHGLGIFEGFK